MISVRADTLTFRFDARPLLENVDLTIEPGDFVCLLGASGSGKSTLLRLMAGLLAPNSGKLQRSPGPLSFVFQEPRLLPWRTVRENVLLPFEFPSAGPARDPEELLRRVGLWEFRGLFPHQLSGGMKQRAAIARALITEPELLLMDEPFSALDEATRYDLEDLLRDLWSRRRMTLVFVTHSIPESVFLGERILLMSRQGGRFLVDRRTSLGERDSELRTQPAFNEMVRDLSRTLRQEAR